VSSTIAVDPKINVEKVGEFGSVWIKMDILGNSNQAGGGVGDRNKMTNETVIVHLASNIRHYHLKPYT
jgi:hypothetical protein